MAVKSELTVAEARAKNVCRVCKLPVRLPKEGVPEGWQTECKLLRFPDALTLNFGEEFAHTSCLRSAAVEQTKAGGGRRDITPKAAVEALTKLGSNKTEYAYQGPDARTLECFPNPKPFDPKEPRASYLVTHEFKEFTSLCPKTGQPDFAEVLVEFVPGPRCVETKSLKLYLFSYRNEGAFMEAICNRVRDDLVAVMAPVELKVQMAFNPRGGIATTVQAVYKYPELLEGRVLDEGVPLTEEEQRVLREAVERFGSGLGSRQPQGGRPGVPGGPQTSGESREEAPEAGRAEARPVQGEHGDRVDAGPHEAGGEAAGGGEEGRPAPDRG